MADNYLNELIKDYVLYKNELNNISKNALTNGILRGVEETKSILHGITNNYLNALMIHFKEFEISSNNDLSRMIGNPIIVSKQLNSMLKGQVLKSNKSAGIYYGNHIMAEVNHLGDVKLGFWNNKSGYYKMINGYDLRDLHERIKKIVNKEFKSHIVVNPKSRE
ncbi:MAG: hypothetical protein EU548_09265 [Promethearchaeota archaeon]|nr:MAG: hypothetical protein EU548_09265 [Candidatus Lokiarchaeota archaeon]